MILDSHLHGALDTVAQRLQVLRHTLHVHHPRVRRREEFRRELRLVFVDGKARVRHHLHNAAEGKRTTKRKREEEEEMKEWKKDGRKEGKKEGKKEGEVDVYEYVVTLRPHITPRTQYTVGFV